MQNKGILMVISGFSGAGKGTLVKKLLSEYDNYALSISMTTRQPREGEEDGREYFSVPENNLKKILQKTDLSSMLSIAVIITEHRKHMWKSRCRQARM